MLIPPILVSAFSVVPSILSAYSAASPAALSHVWVWVHPGGYTNYIIYYPSPENNSSFPKVPRMLRY